MSFVEGEILHRIWKPYVIILSYVVSVFGSLATVAVSEEYRWRKENHLKGQDFFKFMVSACFGGISIWSMHWTAIAARKLANKKSDVISIRVNAFISTGCLLMSILGVFIGLSVASLDKFFSLSPSQRYQLMSISPEISKERAKRKKIFFSDLCWILCGGLISGCFVCIMHYVEMYDMVMDAQIQYQAGLVFASGIVAIMGCSLAFWMIFRFLTWRPDKEIHRVGSAFLLSAGTSGMHYLGEYSSVYTYRQNSHPLYRPVSRVQMNWLLVSAISIVIAFGVLYFAYCMRHKSAITLQSNSEKLLRVVQDVQEKIIRIQQRDQTSVQQESTQQLLENIQYDIMSTLGKVYCREPESNELINNANPASVYPAN